MKLSPLLTLTCILLLLHPAAAQAIPLATALDDPSGLWTSGGASSWAVVTPTDAFTPTAVEPSASLVQGKISWLETTAHEGDEIYFWMRSQNLGWAFPEFTSWGSLTMNDLIVPAVVNDSRISVGSITIGGTIDLGLRTSNLKFPNYLVDPGFYVTAPLLTYQPTTLKLICDGDAATAITLVGESMTPAADGFRTEILTQRNGWTRYVVHLPTSARAHTLRWEYQQGEWGASPLTLDLVQRRASGLPLGLPPDLALGERGVDFTFTPTFTSPVKSVTALNLPPGLTVNETTGVVTGTPTLAGNYPVTMLATNPLGTAQSQWQFKIIPSLGPALEQPQRHWEQSYEDEVNGWHVELTNTEDGMDAARCAGTGTLSTVVTGPEVVMFRQTGRLVFRMDDAAATAVSVPLGDGWSQWTAEVPAGVHRLSWQVEPEYFNGYFTNQFYAGYQSDVYWGGGSSVGLDQVHFQSDHTPQLSGPRKFYGAAGSAFTAVLAVDLPGVNFTATNLPDWLRLDAATGVFSGTAPSAQTWSGIVRASNAAGVAERALEVTFGGNIATAVDSLGITWTQGPPEVQGWHVTEDVVAVAGTPGITPWLEASVVGPDELSFRSLAGWWTGAMVTLWLDGVAVQSYGGNSRYEWETRTLSIPAGTHAVRWTADAPYQQTWLEDVRLASDGRAFFTGSTAFSYRALQPVNLLISVSRLSATFSAVGLPEGWLLDPNTGRITGRALHAGYYTVPITVSTDAGSRTAAFTFSLGGPCYGEWAAWLGLRTRAGMYQDADGDGVSNALELVLGSDPRHFDADLIPVPVQTATGWLWTLPRGEYDTQTLVVSAECTCDLGPRSWFPIYLCASTTNGQPTWQATLPATAADSGRCFCRLRVEVRRVE